MDDDVGPTQAETTSAIPSARRRVWTS
jgi:hypothetical protein